MASKHALSVKSALCAVAAVLAAGCAGAGTGDDGSSVPDGQPISVFAAEASVEPTAEAVPALGGLTVVPSHVELEQAGVVQFAVIARDEFGEPTAIPVVAWSATGGTVTADGRYTAGPWGGDFAVYVQAGSLEASASVAIER